MLFYRKYEHNTSYIDRFSIRNHIRNPPLRDSYDLREVREEAEAPFARAAASPILPKRRRTSSAATFQSRSPRKTSPPISAFPPKATLPTPSKSISPSLRWNTAANTPSIDTKYLCFPRPRQSFFCCGLCILSLFAEKFFIKSLTRQTLSRKI